MRFFYRSLIAPRNTSAVKYVDGLRAISILLVMLGHLFFFLPLRGIMGSNSMFNVFTRIQGDYGVDIFFTISGFLIGAIIFRSIERQSLALPTFYLRRFMRLAPAYYVTLLLLLALPVLPLLSNDKPNYLYNFLYLSNVTPLTQQFMAWSWSLSIEEQFYLVFPLFAALVCRCKPSAIPWLLLSVIVGSQCWMLVLCAYYDIAPFSDPALYMTRYADYIYASTLVRSANLACGLLVAYVLVMQPQPQREQLKQTLLRWRVLPAAALLVLCSIIISGNGFPLPRSSIALLGFYHALISICVAVLMMYLAFDALPLLERFLSSDKWVVTSRLSYSLYLLHPIIYAVVFEWFAVKGFVASDLNISGLIAITILACFAISALMYACIEKPFMDMRDHKRISSG